MKVDREKLMIDDSSDELRKIDQMSDEEFEQYCEELKRQEQQGTD